MLAFIFKFIFLILGVAVLIIVALAIVGSAIIGGIAGIAEVITGKERDRGE